MIMNSNSFFVIKYLSFILIISGGCQVNNESLPYETKLIYDIYNHEFNINEDKIYLVSYLSPLDCQICIDELDYIYSNIDNISIILILDYNNKSIVQQFVEQNDWVNDRSFYVSEEKIDIKDTPYNIVIKGGEPVASSPPNVNWKTDRVFYDKIKEITNK